MLQNTNILFFALAILPSLFYICLLYFVVGRKFLNVQRSKRYLILGFLSTSIIEFIHYVFPEMNRYIFSGNQIINLILKTFIVIAFAEEMAKYTIFWWLTNDRKNKHKDLPIETIFYCVLVSSGFAIMENISYLMAYGKSVLFIRAVSAIIIHFILGIILGYFIAKSKSDIFIYNRNGGEKELSKNSLFKKIFYTIAGVFSATAVHGIYDAAIFLSPDARVTSFYVFAIIFLGLFISYLMIKEAIGQSGRLDAFYRKREKDEQK